MKLQDVRTNPFCDGGSSPPHAGNESWIEGKLPVAADAGSCNANGPHVTPTAPPVEDEELREELLEASRSFIDHWATEADIWGVVWLQRAIACYEAHLTLLREHKIEVVSDSGDGPWFRWRRTTQ